MQEKLAVSAQTHTACMNGWIAFLALDEFELK